MSTEEKRAYEAARERARMALEDAVYRMLEADYTPEQIREEVGYAIESSGE